MITFLWMLYLALTIAFTSWVVLKIIVKAIKRQPIYTNLIVLIFIILISLLWSIWYHYYLH